MNNPSPKQRPQIIVPNVIFPGDKKNEIAKVIREIAQKVNVNEYQFVTFLTCFKTEIIFSCDTPNTRRWLVFSTPNLPRGFFKCSLSEQTRNGHSSAISISISPTFDAYVVQHQKPIAVLSQNQVTFEQCHQMFIDYAMKFNLIRPIA